MTCLTEVIIAHLRDWE